MSDTDNEARRRGSEIADAVLTFRAKQGRKRAKALRGLARSRKGQPPTDKAGPLARAAPSAGVLVAEGDSWFDYPFHDVLRMLEDEHAYEIESVAHKGDRVEDMAYADVQLEEFARRVESVLRRGETPRAILLSGGGNDVTGDDLAILLNHARSPIPGWNEDLLRGIVDERVRYAYITIIEQVRVVTARLSGVDIPLFVHGYDYPVPDGRGFLGGFGPLPGPWLQPFMRRKGFPDLEQNTAMLRDLIDRFNTMLMSVSQLPDFNVHYLDLRNTLSVGKNYKRFWANELHPTAIGFSMVAAKFAAAIEGAHTPPLAEP